MRAPVLASENLGLIVDNTQLLDAIETKFAKPEVTAIIGPNGAGKTSFLRLLAGITTPTNGSITINDRALGSISPRERSRMIGYLPQSPSLAWSIPVKDVVSLGRFAFGGAPGTLNADECAVVEQAMMTCAIDHLANRSSTSLSGGEAARMHCARLIAANTPIMLADEPCASLDPFHQHTVMQILARQAQSGKTVIVVLHDLNLAYQYADRCLVFDHGRLISDGPAKSVLTSETMKSTFKVDIIKTTEGIMVRPRS
ncbi:MAG: ABC transporter ATP-binding protein [Pseudomonadota bacterium]